MGHTPTIVVACLAVALTIIYFVVPDIVHFTVLVLSVAAWFLVAICWLAQKSANYMHNMGSHEHSHEEKKKLASNVGHRQQTVQISSSELSQAKVQLNAELDNLKNTLSNKDKEIENLKTEIANLQTLVQIEALKAELANLKTLAAKESSKNKKK